MPVRSRSPTPLRPRPGAQGHELERAGRGTFYVVQDFSSLAVTEIMYHPPSLGATNGDEFEFLELKNTGTNTLDLSGLQFTDGIAFAFTNGTRLAPGQFFVLARNPAAFAAKYPGRDRQRRLSPASWTTAARRSRSPMCSARTSSPSAMTPPALADHAGRLRLFPGRADLAGDPESGLELARQRQPRRIARRG